MANYPSLVDITTSYELVPGQRALADVTGIGVDVTGHNGKGAVILSSAIGTGTSPTLDVKIQDSATSGGTYVDVTGAAFTQVTDAAASFQTISLNMHGLNNFVRALATITGTSPVFDCAVVLVAGGKADL